MTVYVFIVESANEEYQAQVFENREVVGLTDAKYIETLNLDNLNDLVEDLQEIFKEEVFVTFVDKQYQNKHPYSEEGKLELERLKELREYKEQIAFCNCDWFEFLPEFNGVDIENHYIFLSAKPFKNCYDFANMLQVNLDPNCYFAWNITDLKQGIDAKCYYNVFSNEKRIKQINSKGEPVTIDLDALKWIVEYGVRQVQGMIKAGFLKYESFVQDEVPHWTLNVHSYFSDAIIREFDLIPKPPQGEVSKILKGRTPQEQYNEDTQYRFIVLNYMMTALCKYGLEFGKINTINNNIHTVNYDFLLM